MKIEQFEFSNEGTGNNTDNERKLRNEKTSARRRTLFFITWNNLIFAQHKNLATSNNCNE